MSLFEKSDAKTSLQKGIGCADRLYRLYGEILLLCNGRPMVAPTAKTRKMMCVFLSIHRNIVGMFIKYGYTLSQRPPPTRRGDHRSSAVPPTFWFCIFSKKLVSVVQRKAGYAKERTKITAKAAIARATPPFRKIFEILPSLAGGRSPSRSLMPLVCLNSTKIPAIDRTVNINS